MLTTIIAVLLLFWFIGFIGHIGGGLVHVLLVVALGVFIYQMLTAKKAE